MNKVFISVIIAMMAIFTLSSYDKDDEVRSVEQDKELLDIVNEYSAKARKVSMLSEGRYYTDHNTAHALLTSKKVLMFMNAIHEVM